jgi:hypothetical protein
MFKSETRSSLVPLILSWMLSMALTAPVVGEMIRHSMGAPLNLGKTILTMTRDPPYPDPNPGGYNSHDCGTIKPGSVISTSYAGDESQLSAAYLIRQCNE